MSGGRGTGRPATQTPRPPTARPGWGFGSSRTALVPVSAHICNSGDDQHGGEHDHRPVAGGQHLPIGRRQVVTVWGVALTHGGAGPPPRGREGPRHVESEGC